MEELFTGLAAGFGYVLMWMLTGVIFVLFDRFYIPIKHPDLTPAQVRQKIAEETAVDAGFALLWPLALPISSAMMLVMWYGQRLKKMALTPSKRERTEISKRQRDAHIAAMEIENEMNG